MRDESTMPTPANIYKIISQYESDRRWHKDRTGPGKPSPRTEAKPEIPWYGLSWDQIQKKGFIPQIEKHLIELTRMHGKERSAEYLRHLKGL